MPELSDSDFIVPGQQQADNAIPRFYKKAVKNNYRSNQEGRSVFDTKDYVEILIPGDRLTVVNRPVKEEDQSRWPRYWAAYEKGQEFSVDGTPLEQWTLIDIGMVETLRFFNVRSVEQVANMTDSQVQRVGMGMMELRQKARVWLAQAKENSGISQVVAENNELKQRQAQLEEQVAGLARDAEVARRAALAPAPAPALDPAALQQMIAAAVASTMAAQTPAKPAAKKAPEAPPPAPAPAAALEDSEV